MVFFTLKSISNEDKILDHISEPDNTIGKMLYNSLQQTKSYYKNNRIQMTITFVCAIISCFIGLTVLMVSIFYFNDKSQTMGIISGTVVSFISATFFWIYKQCNNQVQHYFNELIRIQNFFIAMELIEKCNDKTKNQNINKVIDELIHQSAHFHKIVSKMSNIHYSAQEFSLLIFIVKTDFFVDHILTNML